MSMLWVWIGLPLLFVVLEVLTLDLIFLMIAAGSASGAIAYAFGAPTFVQILVAAAVSLLGLFIVRPIALKHLRTQHGDSATNVDALLGKPVRITSTVTSTAGIAMINGETWSARLGEEEQPMAIGTEAIVKAIDGAYLVLTRSTALPTERTQSNG